MKQVTNTGKPEQPDQSPEALLPDAEALPAKNPKEIQEARYALVNTILSKETFIDPLDAEQVTRAYALYERSPLKIVEVLISSFQQYCRKCIREAALLEVKNEISQATIEEAEKIRTSVIEAGYQRIKNDAIVEQLLVMLLFKNKYWEWVRYGLKDIFAEQRMQPGHEINSILNTRFYKLKKEKKMKTVGDLVISDITEIVNAFKGQIMEKKVRLFD